jgi:hypothetical protein
MEILNLTLGTLKYFNEDYDCIADLNYLCVVRNCSELREFDIDKNKFKKLCSFHLGQKNTSRRKRRKVKRELNLCNEDGCNEVCVGVSTLCETHKIISACHTAKISIVNSDIVNLLKQKLIEQNYRDPYNNKIIILGINASLDHIIPKNLGGTNDITNLQWVTKLTNLYKNCRTGDSYIIESFFISVYNIKTIIKYFLKRMFLCIE